MDQIKIGRFIADERKRKGYTQNCLVLFLTTFKNSFLKNLESAIKQFQNGNEEFPIVKDTTPNMMNPRLYTTSYNKPQGQQFDDTAVLSFIKLQYT